MMDSSNQMRKGLWIRFAATAIDVVCVYVATYGVAVAAYVLSLPSTVEAQERLMQIAQAGLMIFCLSFDVYFAATPGKAVLRLCVGNVDGTPATLATRTSRWIAKTSPWFFYFLAAVTQHPLFGWLGGLTLLLILLGCLPILNESRQAWHDQVAGTGVFRRIDVYGRDAAPGRGFPTISSDV
jgi:uncharacterized RDD family membrane protein YckC